jgi:ABC-type cobalamin/Fe3+-siderophores transport system ATPase subunit
VRDRHTIAPNSPGTYPSNNRFTTTGLQARGISKRYRRRAVLHSVDLTVNAGEVAAVIGANGAGKSTFLKICAGLISPDSGTGLLIGALVPRDLEGTLILITVVGLQFLMNPDKGSAKLLPLWSNRELGTYAIDLTDSGYLERGLAHGLGFAAAMTILTAVLATVRLRRRGHMRFVATVNA